MEGWGELLPSQNKKGVRDGIKSLNNMSSYSNKRGSAKARPVVRLSI